MTMLLLPSMRLALYNHLHHQLTVLNLAVEGIVTHGLNTAVIHKKSVRIFATKDLQTTTPSPIADVVFAKKIESVCFDSLGRAILTDKFGDIYSINTEKNSRESPQQDALYLNSNMGIPTLIHSVQDKYLIVGDEETRLKVYNLQNPHQILALWFLDSSIPSQIITHKDKVFVLMRSIHSNKYAESLSQPVFTVHALKIEQLSSENFLPDIVYSSQQLCRMRLMVNHCQGTAYLLELYSQSIKVIPLQTEEKPIFIEIESGDWDYIYASLERSFLLIAYGKTGKEGESELKMELKDGKAKISEQELIVCVQLSK